MHTVYNIQLVNGGTAPTMHSLIIVELELELVWRISTINATLHELCFVEINGTFEQKWMSW